MADTRQFQLPGGGYLNQDANSREWQTAGPYVNEEATAAAGAILGHGLLLGRARNKLVVTH